MVVNGEGIIRFQEIEKMRLEWQSECAKADDGGSAEADPPY